jgi:hypothetical protein
MIGMYNRYHGHCNVTRLCLLWLNNLTFCVRVKQVQERKLLRFSQILAINTVTRTVDLVENSLFGIPQHLQFVQTNEFKTKITFRGKHPTTSAGKIM